MSLEEGLHVYLCGLLTARMKVDPTPEHAGSETLRWTLPRPGFLSMYITLAPERSGLLHVMVADSLRLQEQAVVSYIIRSRKEADDLVEHLFAQWHGWPCGA